MDIQEMHIGVNLGVQKVNSNAFDNFLPEEIDYYLNKAQREYIRRQNIYLKERLKEVSINGKIASSEVLENLGSLITSESLSPPTAVSYFSNAFSFSFPPEFDMFQYLYSTATVNTNERRPCKLVSPHELHLYSKLNYNEPIFRHLPIYISESKFVVFKDVKITSIDSLDVVYIKTPDTVSLTADPKVNSNLPVHTHDEIVDIAVGMILGDLKSVAPLQYEQRTIPKEL